MTRYEGTIHLIIQKIRYFYLHSACIATQHLLYRSAMYPIYRSYLTRIFYMDLEVLLQMTLLSFYVDGIYYLYNNKGI